ncbi:MAG: hypothetical protein PHN56_04405 [Candidatus Nanoarchaeia archaeon]|nr:hypothetical protein [Candidatus Nanoarchaeia archaeon]
MNCEYFISEKIKETRSTSKIIITELKSLYVSDKDKCKKTADMYLDISNNASLINAINDFKKEYNL